jgi:hypothetical protein
MKVHLAPSEACAPLKRIEGFCPPTPHDWVNDIVDGTVRIVALQLDGKVIIGGQFTTMRGLERTNLACLNADESGGSSFALFRKNIP